MSAPMADLRDHLDEFEAAAQRALANPRPTPVRLTDRNGIGHVLWRIRRDAGHSPDGLAARLGMSRSGVAKRESDGRIPASALIAHAQALGYDLALVPREPA